jgi:hypothetical protein
MDVSPRRRPPHGLLATLAGGIAGAAAGIAVCAGAPGVGALASESPPRADQATRRALVAVDGGAPPVAAALAPARRGASPSLEQEGDSP